MLNIIDEFTHECLAIQVSRRLKSIDVIDVLSDLFILRGVPGHVRSDNGPEFVAKAVQEWIGAVGANTAYITPGSPWENGFIESFNARLRDELLDGEIFYTLREAQIIIESWRRHYNTVRPHASIGYRAPAPEVFVPALAAWPAAQPRPAPPAMRRGLARTASNDCQVESQLIQLKGPARQPKRARLWLNDGSCIRLRAERPNHVWSYDFVEERTHDGRKFRMLNIIDEFTHECLAIRGRMGRGLL